MTFRHTDCLIIGGGVIGLSIAYELARHDVSVHVIDRQQVGRGASWAGAGILPPANRDTAIHPYDQLCGLTVELHPQWAASLLEETGIDTGFRQCGGIYVARSMGEAAALAGQVGIWREQGIRVEPLDSSELLELEPALETVVHDDAVRKAYLLPGESQLRNPHHLQALTLACEQRGVVVTPNASVA